MATNLLQQNRRKEWSLIPIADLHNLCLKQNNFFYVPQEKASFELGGITVTYEAGGTEEQAKAKRDKTFVVNYLGKETSKFLNENFGKMWYIAAVTVGEGKQSGDGTIMNTTYVNSDFLAVIENMDKFPDPELLEKLKKQYGEDFSTEDLLDDIALDEGGHQLGTVHPPIKMSSDDDYKYYDAIKKFRHIAREYDKNDVDAMKKAEEFFFQKVNEELAKQGLRTYGSLENALRQLKIVEGVENPNVTELKINENDIQNMLNSNEIRKKKKK